MKSWCTVRIPSSLPLGRPEPPRSTGVWVDYDTIHSDRPTAEQALEQVLGFLEMRCQ